MNYCEEIFQQIPTDKLYKLRQELKNEIRDSLNISFKEEVSSLDIKFTNEITW